MYQALFQVREIGELTSSSRGPNKVGTVSFLVQTAKRAQLSNLFEVTQQGAEPGFKPRVWALNRLVLLHLQHLLGPYKV